MIGQTISHYRILSELGKGAMSVVYLAIDKRLNRNVAIKMLGAEHLARTNQNHSRLLREARAISQINHPNIATIYDYGETQDGQPFIVMEYIEGDTLSDILKRRSLSVSRSVEIIASVASALAEAHGKGIIHRDIKPSNIIINKRNEVKVLDFGLAKQIEGFAPQHDVLASVEAYGETQTREGVVVGTPLYLSPEQALGGPIDQRSDIFSLGSVFYECLTGHPPFQAPSVIEICAKVLRDEPLPPSQLNPDVSPKIDEIVSKVLAKSPELRYQTAREFLHSLKNLKPISTNGLVTTDMISSRDGHIASETNITPLIGTNSNEIANTIKHIADTQNSSQSGLRSALSSLFEKESIRKNALMAAVMLMFAGTIISFGAYFFYKNKEQNLGMRPLEVQKLSIPGDIKESVISPNGEYVASIVRESSKQKIQLSDIRTNSNIKIFGLTESTLKGLSFSPDGGYIYFLEMEAETGTLYRIARLGEGRRKISSNVNTPVSFSHDEDKMAFIRYNKKDETTELVIASTDGTNEKVVAVRKSPDEFVLGGDDDSIGPAWSQSGNLIACPIKKKTTTGSTNYVEIINIADGSSVKQFGGLSWYLISNIVWKSDDTGLFISAADEYLSPTQILYVPYPNGKPISVTQDASSYIGMSTTSDSKTIYALKTEPSSSVWLGDANKFDSFKMLSSTYNRGIRELVSFSGNEVFFTANTEKKVSLLRVGIKDENTHQITSNIGNIMQPVISPDQKFLVFVSTKSGINNIWRADKDGTNLVQLTKVSSDSPNITSDGKSVIYHGFTPTGDRIWTVPIEGGEPTVLLDMNAMYPTASPDGRMIAFYTWEKEDSSAYKLAIYSVAEKRVKDEFALLPSFSLGRLRWSPDSRGLVYVVRTTGSPNLWLQPLNKEAPKPLTDFEELEILDFAWSEDGQKIACVRGMTITNAQTIKNIP